MLLHIPEGAETAEEKCLRGACLYRATVKGQTVLRIDRVWIMKLRGDENDAVIAMLEKNPLWAGLDKKDLKAIIKASKEHKFETGDIILSKGEGGVGFYLIMEGSVEIKSDGNILAKLGPGQFFGEMAVLDNQPRSADVIAAEPSRCFIVSEWGFKALISENPKIALKMLEEFARRIRNINKSLNQ